MSAALDAVGRHNHIIEYPPDCISLCMATTTVPYAIRNGCFHLSGGWSLLSKRFAPSILIIDKVYMYIALIIMVSKYVAS